jgi:predicted nuclease with TOPRIM domain
MNDELKLLAEYAPQLLGFAGAILLLLITSRLILFVKRELFAGVVSIELFTAQIEREKKMVEAAEDVAQQLQEIVAQLSELTAGINAEIKENTERLRSLEMAMSSYLEEFARLNHNFELHRRGYVDTSQLRLEK